MLSICKGLSWCAGVTSGAFQCRQHEYPLFSWWRTTFQVLKCRLCWEMQIWPCGLAWIYRLSLLFACKHAVCKEAAWSHMQGQVLMSKLCTGWGCASPSMPQASSPANTRFQLFLTMVWMLWMHLGYCQQCCLQDSVCSLCLNQLPNHCAGIVQSIRSVLVNKMPSCLASQTSES